MSKSKPKILRIINRLNLGGPTYNASYLSKYLSPDFETLLVAGMKDDSEASSEFIAKSMGLEPIMLPEMKRSINPFKDISAYRKIREIIRRYQPDIVHTHAAKAGAVGRIAAFNEKVPVILHTFHGHVFHSYFHSAKTKVFLEIERYLARKSTAIIAISQQQKNELVSEFNIAPGEKISVVPLGFDLSRFQEDIESKRKRFRTDWNIDDEEIAIGIIGRLVPIKNHGMFLKGLKYIAAHTDKPIRAFIIGDGEDYAKIREQAIELGMEWTNERGKKALLTFTSWINEIDVVNAGLDIITLTSLNEGTPVSLIEAQAAGKPVVSTRVGGVEDVIIAGKTGFLCPTNDHLEFSELVLRLVENEELREEMGGPGMQNVIEKYSYQRLISDMRNLYDQLLNT